MSLKDSVNRLEQRPPADKRLPAAVTPAAKRATTGLAVANSAGIASPLTETAYADRAYFNAQTLTSTDGIFTIEWEPIKTMSFTDANGNAAMLEFKEPV